MGVRPKLGKIVRSWLLFVRFRLKMIAESHILCAFGNPCPSPFNIVTLSKLHYCNGLTGDCQDQLTSWSRTTPWCWSWCIISLTLQYNSSGAISSPNFNDDENGVLGVTRDIHCNNLYAAGDITGNGPANYYADVTGYTQQMQALRTDLRHSQIII